jgi:hypothetical protein
MPGENRRMGGLSADFMEIRVVYSAFDGSTT